MWTPPRSRWPGRARTPTCPASRTARSAGSSRTPANMWRARCGAARNIDGIILDPPKYGRGPTGEVWRLFEDLPELVARLRRPAGRKRLLPAAERLCRAHLGPVAGAPDWPRPRPGAAASSTGASWPWPKRAGAAPRSASASSPGGAPRERAGHHLPDQSHGQGRPRPAHAQGARRDRPVPGRGAEDSSARRWIWATRRSILLSARTPAATRCWTAPSRPPRRTAAR